MENETAINYYYKVFSKRFKIWIRYVDGVFVITKRFVDTPLSPVLDKLKSYDQSIQFTIKLEDDNTLGFLNVQFMRFDNYLQTTVYRKPNSNIILIL